MKLVLKASLLIAFMIFVIIVTSLRGYLTTLYFAGHHVSYWHAGVDKRSEETKADDVKRFHIAPPGDNIQAGELEVFLTTAVHYPDFPARGGFNVFLNGWARHESDMNFKCCLIRSLPGGDPEDIITEVQSYVYHIYDQWVVDMQSAEFSCSISNQQLSTIGGANFSYVTFAEASCLRAYNDVMRIIYPRREAGTVGICLKISYDVLDPEKLVEWFEYIRVMNVTKVFTYTFEVQPSSLKVLQYYQGIGLLDMQPIHPAKSKSGPKRGFKRPRFERQAWTDEVMAANDCKHRMSGYDYVIVMDADEFILPHGNLSTYFEILQEAAKQKPNAGAFSFDSHVVMLDWGATRDSPLHIMKYVTRTTEPNYDGAKRNTRWAFKPLRTYFAKNNEVAVQQNYTVVNVSPNTYTLLHYRYCKAMWKGCKLRARTEDSIMLKYERQLGENLLKLPLDDVLYNKADYIRNLKYWGEKDNIPNTRRLIKT